MENWYVGEEPEYGAAEHVIGVTKWKKKRRFMKIYVHKVRMGGEDGWGRSLPVTQNVLGRYSTLEKAKEAKHVRDENNNRWFDVGLSWIDEEEVE